MKILGALIVIVLIVVGIPAIVLGLGATAGGIADQRRNRRRRPF